MGLQIVQEIGLHDVADAIMGDFHSTAQLLILIASDCGPGDTDRLAVSLNLKLSDDVECRPDLRRLGELLVKAADSA